MTNDVDELLSAYIDGETTPEETARVEADPELRAAAATMRALSGEVGRVPAATAEVRSAHLAAALEAFDLGPTVGLVDGAAEGAGADHDHGDGGPEVVSFQERQAARRRRQLPGVPSWLGAAAAAVIVVGGIGFALQQTGGSDDEAASVAATEAEETAGSSDADAAADSGEDFALEAEQAEAESAPLLDEAERDADDGAEEAADDEAAASEPALTTTTAPGLFPEEIERNRVLLDDVPTEEEQAVLAADELLPFEWSTCGPQVDAAEPVGFRPVSIDGVLGELLVFRDAAGSLVPVLLDGGCDPF